LVTYTKNASYEGNATRLAVGDRTSRFPPELNDVVSFDQTSDRRFAVAVRIDQSKFFFIYSLSWIWSSLESTVSFSAPNFY